MESISMTVLLDAKAGLAHTTAPPLVEKSRNAIFQQLMACFRH